MFNQLFPHGICGTTYRNEFHYLPHFSEPVAETLTVRALQILQSHFGVIDVVDLKLTALPVIEAQNFSAGKGKEWATSTKGRIRASYVALSYVWGQGEKAYTTTRNNVMLRRRHGGLENSIADYRIRLNWSKVCLLAI